MNQSVFVLVPFSGLVDRLRVGLALCCVFMFAGVRAVQADPYVSPFAFDEECALKENALSLELYLMDNGRYPKVRSTGLAPGVPTPGALYEIVPEPGSEKPYRYVTNGRGDYAMLGRSAVDAPSLSALPRADVRSSGLPLKARRKCGGACSRIGYSNVFGLFGY